MYLISKEDRIENKRRFLELLRGINRPGADLEGLISELERGDFFTAPLTERAYRNYDGGLCEQALCRHYHMELLAKESSTSVDISRTSELIVSLLADLGRMNYFEKTSRNKKVYSESGKKFDELGKFDWVAESGFTVKDPSERYIFGTMGQNSERLVSQFIPLTDEESASIIHLHANYENPSLNCANIYMKFPLAVLLNSADLLASFIDTKKIEEVDEDDTIPF